MVKNYLKAALPTPETDKGESIVNLKRPFFYWSVFNDSPYMKLQQVKHPTM